MTDVRQQARSVERPSPRDEARELRLSLSAQQSAETLLKLGQLALRSRQPLAAIGWLAQATGVDPLNVEVVSALGAAHQELGNLGEALCYHQHVLRMDSEHVQALCNLGVVLARQEQAEQAVPLLERAVSRLPNDPVLWCNLGAAQRAAKNLQEARKALGRCLELAPTMVQAHFNMGHVLDSLDEPTRALQSYQRAAELAPDFVEAHYHAARVLHLRGEAAKAAAQFQWLLQCWPEHREARFALAEIFLQQNRLVEAREVAEQGVARAPHSAEGHNVLGNVLAMQGLLDGAIQRYQQSLQIKPQLAAARYNLGRALLAQGDLDQAQEQLKSVWTQEPGQALAHSTYLGALLYDPRVSPETLAHEHRHWADVHLAAFTPQSKHVRDPNPERRLRIGYVSPDYRNHAVAYFLEPILANHNRDRFEIFGYSDVTAPDEKTEHLQSLCDHRRVIVGRSAREVAALIDEDQIDVLIDLAGYTASARLAVFALKPAPIQVSYLGYPCTTGLDAIDYRIVDEITAPDDQPDYGSEKLLRLPTPFCCYQPPEDVPMSTELPSQKTGRITFGSLHKLEKLNDEVLDTWCRIVQSVSGSRLLFCRHVLQGHTAKRLADRLKARGLTDDQFDFQWAQPINRQHLRHYESIDLALDAWPWNGHTTACEALWMGVPVLTLQGDRHASRMVASVLTSLGLADCIAASTDEYVQIACDKSREQMERSSLRKEMRERMGDSLLLDGARFSRNFETALCQMWRKHCHQGIET